jgi:RHS repeat-associated protein
MVYNASNKMTQFTATGVSVAYRYDAKERRVRQDSGGQTTIWVYDAFGQLAAEYSTNLTMVQGVYYRTTDHLGSTRIVTNQSAAVVQRRDFFPFGEAIPADSSHGNRHLVLDGGQAAYNATLDLRQQFTGQQRDGDTGLDYFLARNYFAPLGRFLSIDPGSAGARPPAPQSWNGYAYVENRPLIATDPMGLALFIPDDDTFNLEFQAAVFNGPTLDYYDDPYSGFAPYVELSQLYLPPGWGYNCTDWTCNELTVTISQADYEQLVSDLGYSLAPNPGPAGTAIALCAAFPIPCAVTVGGAVVITVSYVAYEALAKQKKKQNEAREKRRKSKPKDALSGTRPIDQIYSKDEVHKIKQDLELGNDDWVGVTEDGRIISTNPETGEAIDHGKW